LHYIKKEIQRQNQRLQELESKSTQCVQILSAQPKAKGSTSDRTGEYGSARADLRELIEIKNNELEKKRLEIERYIQTVDDSYMRELLRLRYIDCKSWQGVAMAMGGMNTKDGVRMAVSRFLEKH